MNQVQKQTFAILVTAALSEIENSMSAREHLPNFESVSADQIKVLLEEAAELSKQGKDDEALGLLQDALIECRQAIEHAYRPHLIEWRNEALVVCAVYGFLMAAKYACIDEYRF